MPSAKIPHKRPVELNQGTLLQALFTLFNFHFPLTVALLQMAVIAPVCYAVAKPKLEWGLARAFIPLSLVNVLNVICGLMGKAMGTTLSYHRQTHSLSQPN